MPHKPFSGETPYAICEQYAAGKIDGAQLGDELTRWEYAPPARTKDYFDDLLFDAPGSTDDLERARRRGLIDEDTFCEIADRLEALHEVDPEKRQPELFASLTPAQHEQVAAACWHVLNDGFPLERESVERITTLLVDDPQQFAILYGPYIEAKPGGQVDVEAWREMKERMRSALATELKRLEQSDYAELAERAEHGELRVKPDGISVQGAAAEGQRLLMEATGATSVERSDPDCAWTPLRD
ncbi:hypothetical protein [Leucobacter massiliensis]|uniref:hypothetical protein n=1 Tax=Leucobacter massiliensis TaxID=1686285 RepID=UPI0011B25879|nr:hypothetical protein [Leucobacter massiliensis]